MAADAGAFEHHLAARIGAAPPSLCEAGAGGASVAGRSGDAIARHAAQIGDDGADVFRRQLAEAVVDRFAHRARGGAVAGGVAGREIGDEIVVAPAADAGGLVAN